MSVAARKKQKRPTGSANPRAVVAAARAKGTRTTRSSRAPRVRWEAVKSLLGAAAIFLLIRTFLIEAYRIPSESMVPTLLVGDFLFVNKVIFGAHIPFTDHAALPGYAEPQRGQVAIYKSPDDRDGNPIVVKRLVGVAGDTMYMRKGVLYVNGVEQRYRNAAPPDPTIPDEAHPDFDWQKEVGLQQSRFGPAPKQPTHDNWGPFVVPPRHFFSMGDNRYNSKDARYYGFVPRENLRGKPLFIYYSHDCKDSDVGVPLCFITAVRWSRIGDRVR